MNLWRICVFSEFEVEVVIIKTEFILSDEEKL